MSRGSVCLLALATALLACSRDDRPAPEGPPSDLDLVKPPGQARPLEAAAVVFHPDGKPAARVAVEIAVRPHDIQRGLMYREHLAPDAGMIFLFRSSKVQHFWMKNTLIPLDMIFVTRDRTVAGVVADTVPRALDSRFVDRESQFVVEVNAGWARAHGVVAGTRVSFENVPVERAVVD